MPNYTPEELDAAKTAVAQGRCARLAGRTAFTTEELDFIVKAEGGTADVSKVTPPKPTTPKPAPVAVVTTPTTNSTPQVPATGGTAESGHKPEDPSSTGDAPTDPPSGDPPPTDPPKSEDEELASLQARLRDEFGVEDPPRTLKGAKSALTKALKRQEEGDQP